PNPTDILEFIQKKVLPVVQETFLPFPVKAIERMLDDIIDIICYTFSVNICCGQSTKEFKDVVHIRGNERNEFGNVLYCGDTETYVTTE
ncbi:5735_t:CDS:2, partial [Diversispora eburnea]